MSGSKMMDYSYLHKAIPGLVSVIIPTHNRSGLLKETLDSFENQSYDMIEIIIVDDHSSDDTPDVVAAYAAQSRFNIIYLKSKRRGGNCARNLGLINSKGSFVQFFDDDDLVNRDFITERLRFFEDKSIGFVTCNFEYFKGDESNITGEKKISDITHDIINHLYYTSLPTPCFLIRRETIEKIGFWNEQVKKLQDLSFFQRLFKYKIEGKWLDVSLFKVRLHSNNLSQRVDELSRLQTWEIVCNEWKGYQKYNVVALVCMCHMCFCIKRLFKEKKLFKMILGVLNIALKRPWLLVKYLIVSKFGKIKERQLIELLEIL